jgi:type I restriction enzyme S subunit
MAMKAGYKQTEAGVLPEDWDVALMDSVAKRGSGHTPDKQHPEYWGGSIKWISLKDSDRLDTLYIADTSATITPAGIANSSAVMHRAGTVVLSRDAGVGKSSIMKDEMAVSQHFIAWLCGPRLDNHFLYYWLQAKKSEFERIAFGNTIKTIGLSYFKKLKIPLPLLPEQRMIAAALITVDALISELEQLINKKGALKRAAMQQLLTGKQRLPGFSGRWEKKRLGDVFTIFAGQSKSAFVADGGQYWIVDMGSVSVAGKLIVSKATNYSGDFLETGDLVMPKDDIGGGNIIGKVGYITADSTFVLGDHVYCLRARQGDPLFLSYVINSHKINTALRRKAIGSAQLGLGRKSVSDQEIPFPDPTEQAAIAAVLTDMDAEITALERRRDKTGAIKQGMMQELLIGKTRLI